jgi:UTP-glucose-1-phosphate uridylyltransferase
MTRPSVKFGNVSSKMAEISEKENIQPTPEVNAEPEQELITGKRQLQLTSEIEKEIRARQYVKKRVHTGCSFDVETHQDFKIACIREGKTMEEILEELAMDFIRKSKKRFEK